MITFMSDNSIVKLLKTKQTVFSTQDLALLWKISNKNYLKTKIYRLIKGKNLTRIKSGVFAFGSDFNQWELANKLVVPSYVSLQTVLSASGVVFQFDSRVNSISNRSRSICADSGQYDYRKIKDSVLLSREGIITNDNTNYASPERALLDTLYLECDAYIDNPKAIDWEKARSLAHIYQSKILIKRLNKIYGQYI